VGENVLQALHSRCAESFIISFRNCDDVMNLLRVSYGRWRTKWLADSEIYSAAKQVYTHSKTKQFIVFPSALLFSHLSVDDCVESSC
jgi:hypothetical protein